MTREFIEALRLAVHYGFITPDEAKMYIHNLMVALTRSESDISLPKYFREGIKTFSRLNGVFERCDKHGKVWHEGATYKEGACKECIKNAEK